MMFVTKEFCVNFIDKFEISSKDDKKFIISSSEIGDVKNPNYKTQEIESSVRLCLEFLKSDSSQQEISLQEKIDLISKLDTGLQLFQQRIEKSIKNRWWYSWVNPLAYRTICPQFNWLHQCAESVKSNLEREIEQENRKQQRIQERNLRELEMKKLEEDGKKRNEEIIKLEEEWKEIEDERKESKQLFRDFMRSRLLAEKVPVVSSQSEELILCYELLIEEIEKEKPIFCLQEGSIHHQEQLLGVLGHGGSKDIREIEGGRALTLPNMGSNPIDVMAKEWERLVTEEVNMSSFLTSLGLLNLDSKRLDTQFPNIKETIPVYVSDTFQNMALTKGIFVIDVKNWSSSIWKQGTHFMFENKEDRLVENKWGPIVDSLLTDIAKICVYNIPTSMDSCNVAIVRKDNQTLIGHGEYQIRYFGFDFSSKDVLQEIPPIKLDYERKFRFEKNKHEWQELIDKEDKDKAEKLFSSILDIVFFCEFHPQYENNFDEKEKLREFKKRLVDGYLNEILNRIMHYRKTV